MYLRRSLYPSKDKDCYLFLSQTEQLQKKQYWQLEGRDQGSTAEVITPQENELLDIKNQMRLLKDEQNLLGQLLCYLR